MNKKSASLSVLLAGIVAISGCSGSIQPIPMDGCPDGDVEILAVADKAVEHTSGRFLEQVNRTDDVLVLVDFWATWCGPCVMMAPELESVKKQWGDQLVILKVDVDQNPQLSQFFNISSIPQVRIFRSGRYLTGFSGLRKASDINSTLKSLQ